MRNQLLAEVCRWRVLTGTKDDILARGVCQCVDRPCRCGGGDIGVYSNVAEIAAKPEFHEAARSPIQRSSRRTQHLVNDRRSLGARGGSSRTAMQLHGFRVALFTFAARTRCRAARAALHTRAEAHARRRGQALNRCGSGDAHHKLRHVIGVLLIGVARLVDRKFLLQNAVTKKSQHRLIAMPLLHTRYGTLDVALLVSGKQGRSTNLRGLRVLTADVLSCLQHHGSTSYSKGPDEFLEQSPSPFRIGTSRRPEVAGYARVQSRCPVPTELHSPRSVFPGATLPYGLNARLARL